MPHSIAKKEKERLFKISINTSNQTEAESRKIRAEEREKQKLLINEYKALDMQDE